MNHIIPEHIEKLTDDQLYALSRCEVLHAGDKALLKREIRNRQLDNVTLEAQWNVIVHKPLPKLTANDQWIIWLLAVCFPMVLMVILLPVWLVALIYYPLIFFYFHANPLRFKTYWQRGIISVISWLIIALVYIHFFE